MIVSFKRFCKCYSLLVRSYYRGNLVWFHPNFLRLLCPPPPPPTMVDCFIVAVLSDQYKKKISCDLRWLDIVSNGHKYPKQKQHTPNLTSFAQIGLAIMFTTNSCVKHRILHVLRALINACEMLTPFRT